MMHRALRAVVYVGSFGLGRGALFISPLVLANLLAPSHYGMLEFAQAIASLAVPILALGTASVVPLVLVRHIPSASWRAVLLHHLCCATAALVLFGLLLALGTEIAWLVALAIGALLLQALWSVTLKSTGHAEASLLLDTGFWGSLALAAAIAFAFAQPGATRWAWVLGALGLYVTGLGAWTLRRLLLESGPRPPLLYLQTLQTGLPLMTGGLLALLATTSGRLGVGVLAGPELTAEYAVLFRATAVPVVAHQILMVAVFRKLFEVDQAILERGLPVIVAAVTACVLLFWAASDFIAPVFGNAFELAFARNRTETVLILAQSILWSAIALNDLVNTRLQTTAPVAKACAAYLAAALPLAWYFLSRETPTLAVFVPAHSLLMAGYFLVQAGAMWFAGARIARTWALTLAAFAAISVSAQFQG